MVTFPKSSINSFACLSAAIQARVELTPHAIAMIHGAQSLTFSEFARRSDSLAAELSRRGASTGKFIGIALPRSTELIIALLAVLKTGAAYIPIDPSYPVARIGHMIQSSGIDLVITDTDHSPQVDKILTIDVNGEWTNVDWMPSPSTPEDLIYAIFTSGSTGQAKAASVFHRGFINLLDWYIAELDLTSRDVTLVISSPSFDLTQKNFFAPLLSGGRLILDHGTNYDIHRISSLVRENQVTLLNCTPSAFYPLVDAAAADGYAVLSSLRFVVLGGEPISISRLRSWLEHPSCSAEVVNTYGPTECTDICAFYRLHRGNIDRYPFVPTGAEIPNVAVTIRDEQLHPLPTGELGELCIEGIGIGGGYLNDPARTSERFVNGLYRTGDLAKRLEEGVIEFRGRADHQVKVNGFRIELGEIETALATHPDVREAVVLADDQRLIAWFEGPAEIPALKEHLASRLPAYMMPSAFHPLQKFPLTPNGKVDRKALSETQADNDASFPALPPDNALESKILDLWSEVLERRVTDPAINFFDLGGTSIHLAILHIRLRESTGRDLTITDFFAHPTARSLAAYLDPQAKISTLSQVHDRARLQQAGLSRFRRPLAR